MTTAGQRWAWRAGTVALALTTVAALLLGPYRQLLVGSVAGSWGEDRPGPCLPGQARPLMDSPHVSQAQAASVRYNSDPPTSGPHFAFVVAPGIYATPLADGLTLHALEHGHVAIQYAPTTPVDMVGRLRSVAKRYSADVIMAPRDGLDGIALTAWGRIDRFATVDDARVIAFVEAMRGRYSHGWTRQDSGCPPVPAPAA